MQHEACHYKYCHICNHTMICWVVCNACKPIHVGVGHADVIVLQPPCSSTQIHEDAPLAGVHPTTHLPSAPTLGAGHKMPTGDRLVPQISISRARSRVSDVQPQCSATHTQHYVRHTHGATACAMCTQVRCRWLVSKVTRPQIQKRYFNVASLHSIPRTY